MRLATILTEDGNHVAIVPADAAYPIQRGGQPVRDMVELIVSPLTDDEVAAALAGPPIELARVKWRPPVRPPKNVFCAGLNYRDHVTEGKNAGRALPTEPVWFTKPHTSLTGHDEDLLLPRRALGRLDFEGELGVVVKSRCREVSRADALQHVFGYTIVNDLSARDLQQSRGQWFLGKAGDAMGPCGPWIVTADDIPDPQSLTLTTTVNGEVRQQASTTDMIFDVATLISDVSSMVTLEPGDLIATGTPSGVGMATDSYLKPGDVVTIEISSIGRLNTVVRVR